MPGSESRIHARGRCRYRRVEERKSRHGAHSAPVWRIWSRGVSAEGRSAEPPEGRAYLSATAGGDREILRDEATAGAKRGDARDFRFHGRCAKKPRRGRKAREAALGSHVKTAGGQEGPHFGNRQ